MLTEMLIREREIMSLSLYLDIEYETTCGFPLAKKVTQSIFSDKKSFDERLARLALGLDFSKYSTSIYFTTGALCKS
jgi:hypothetical protein